MARGFTYSLDGRIPDASLRVIDDAEQSLLVLLIDHQSEVGDDVHDLLVVEERPPPIDAEGETDTTEDLLEATALRIRSIEYRYRAVASARSVEALNLFASPERLEIACERLVYLDRITDGLLGEDLLGDLILIVCYDPSGSLYDGLGGAVVALELEGACAGEGLREAQHIV